MALFVVHRQLICRILRYMFLIVLLKIWQAFKKSSRNKVAALLLISWEFLVIFEVSSILGWLYHKMVIFSWCAKDQATYGATTQLCVSTKSEAYSEPSQTSEKKQLCVIHNIFWLSPLGFWILILGFWKLIFIPWNSFRFY